MHASVRQNEARGIGYNKGYTTLEAFGIYDGYGSGFMPFIDLRGHVFNNGKLAGNLGIGERTFLPSINHTFGSYLYYDVRRVGHGLTVNQLSPGLELVGERMEYRINGYFPVGKLKGRQYRYEFDKFKGNSILLKSKQFQAMRGFDAEVGAHIPQNTTYDVYMAAGPYYFQSSNAHSWGGSARLLGRYKEYVSLEVTYSYDNLFRSVVQGSVALTLPFGGKLKRCGPDCGRGCPQTDNLLLSRAAFAPSRLEIPVVKKVHKREKAIDPATGKPWVVWFVNNTSHSAGTFESPFPTLLQAENASSPNDMIYVFSGDGTTNGMNAGITLQDGQNFFGSGVKQQFSTTKGTVTIPALSVNNPSISNTAGNVVTLGNGNVVSGFNVSVVNSNGIVNTGSINGATIMNNVIAIETSGNSIAVTGSGAVNISNNQINDLGGMGETAIGVAPTGGGMNGMISNNSTAGFTNGITIDPIAAAGYDFTLEGNTITNFRGIGIDVLSEGPSTIDIIGNTIETNLGMSGIMIGGASTDSDVLIDDNYIVFNSAAATNGIGITLGSSDIVISNNTVQSIPVSDFIGIGVTSIASGTINLEMYSNTVTISDAIAYDLDLDTKITPFGVGILCVSLYGAVVLGLTPLFKVIERNLANNVKLEQVKLSSPYRRCQRTKDGGLVCE